MSAVMKVSAPDRGRAFVLAGMLADYSAVVLTDNGQPATVIVDGVAEDSVSPVLHIIEEWVNEEGIKEARVEIGDRAYTMAG